MKTLYFLSIVLLSCVSSACNGQQPIEKNYIDFLKKGNRLFALTASGHINVFDTNTGKTIGTNIHADTTILAIGIDKKGNIIVSKANQQIDRLNDNKLNFSSIFKSKEPVYNIVFSSNNKTYLITNKGINDASSGKTYMPDTTVRLNKQIRGWGKPSAVFIDMDDNIWVGSGHGEWGGELFVFSTVKKRFVKPELNRFQIDLYPVKSLFSAGNSIYMSAGLQHMTTSGCITKFTNKKCTLIFDSETKYVDHKPTVDGEYIGPAAYNNKDNCLYFYSQHGIFKGNKEKDLSQLNAWTKIAVPKLHWINGQSDAVGSQMNVLKMSFDEKGELYILTQNDGIAVYNEKGFRLLN